MNPESLATSLSFTGSAAPQWSDASLPGFYVVFAWGAAFMLLPLLPTLSAVFGRRQNGWWVVYGALTLVSEGLGLALARDHDVARLVAVLAGLAWWEGVLQTVTTRGAAPRWARWPHWAAAEAGLLLIAVELAGGGARPEWFAPVLWLLGALPVLFGLGGAILLWRALEAEPDPARRTWLRTTIAALGAATVAPVLVLISVVALSRAVWRSPVVRTRLALGFAAVYLLVGAAAPLLAELHTRREARQLEAARLGRAEVLANDAFKKNSQVESEILPGWLRTAAIELRADGGEKVMTWRIRGKTWEYLDPEEPAAGWRTGTAGVPATAEQTAGGRAFAAESRRGRNDQAVAAGVWLHAPIRPSRFERPVAWLAVHYPASGDAAEALSAGRGGLAAAGGLAFLCALGFVFACRLAEENEQRVALSRAEAASRAKTEFLAFLSHELRTPLQTILGRAGLIRRNGDADTARQAAAIEEQGRLMLRLVGDLLDLGAVEAGKLELRPSVFSLRERLEVVRAELGVAAAAKGLRLELDVAADAPDSLLGDEARLRQIVANLWGNAVRYTPKGWARMEVRREPAGANVAALAFRVTDSGPGLPPDKLDRLFTLFTRLDAGTDFRREGTGVGLALVRRLCDLMGGTVTAANLPEGGAEFVARLVFPPADARATAVAKPAGPEGRKRVLVADDNAAARAYLLDAVRALGHEAEAVGDGEAALRAAEAGGWDLLLLDVNMPGMDGIAVARALRDRPGRPRMIACSAEAFAHTQTEALAAGMEAFLQKPVDIEVLESALGAAGPAPEGEGDLFARLSGGGDGRLLELVRADWPDWRRRAEAALAAGDAETVARLVHHWRSHALLLRDDVMREALDALVQAEQPEQRVAAWERLADRVRQVSAGDERRV